MNTVVQKPPPKTVASKTIVKKMKSPKMDVEIHAQVLGDVTDNGITGGITKYESVPTTGRTIISSTPGYEWKPTGRLKVISKVKGPAEIKAIIKIQTSYGSKSKPEHLSAYGKGTTPEDKRTGNSSLGFHEACHRNDFLEYLKIKPLPTFSGKVGMTLQQYTKAAESFISAVDKYFSDMDKYSKRKTDEVGYKMSTYKAKKSSR